MKCRICHAQGHNKLCCPQGPKYVSCLLLIRLLLDLLVIMFPFL